MKKLLFFSLITISSQMYSMSFKEAQKIFEQMVVAETLRKMPPSNKKINDCKATCEIETHLDIDGKLKGYLLSCSETEGFLRMCHDESTGHEKSNNVFSKEQLARHKITYMKMRRLRKISEGVWRPKESEVWGPMSYFDAWKWIKTNSHPEESLHPDEKN